jgi:hypothetical protein
MAETVTIDLVTKDRANDEWVLYLVEDGPWPSGQEGWEAKLKGIQDRIFRAVDVMQIYRVAPSPKTGQWPHCVRRK